MVYVFTPSTRICSCSLVEATPFRFESPIFGWSTEGGSLPDSLVFEALEHPSDERSGK